MQYDIILRPLVYLAAIIVFWYTIKRKGDCHWRLATIMLSLFLVSMALTFYENNDSDDKVITVLDQAISYQFVKAFLENMCLFAIVVSVLLLLTRRLDTAQREVRQLAQIASSSADAIVGFDATGKITSWNRGAELVFGYFTEEITGQNVHHLVAEECVADFDAAAERCQGDGFVRGLSCRMVGKGRKVALTEVTLSPIYDEDGKRSGTSLFVRDVTEQKEMEKELMRASKMSAMGTMAAGVVQEFGNLLTVISARAQLGTTAERVEEAREEFDAISSCAGRARSVINNLLAYAKRQRPRKVLGKISDAADSAVALLEKELERSKVVVHRRYEAVPETAFDPDQMQHVFANLMINALNAMRDTGGSIEISVSTRQEYIEVTMRDDGPGIAEELMARLFEPFDGGADHDRTGLGLFVCRQIIKFHNGNITVESRRNEGTVFRIYLPVTATSEVTRSGADTRILDPQRCKVAVVDRDNMIRDLLAQALRRRSIVTETFQDAESAAEAGVKENFDVVFIDLSIRDATGQRFVEGLKGNLNRMVVGMIGEAVGPEELHRIDEGLFQTLRKPFGLDEINAICNVISPQRDSKETAIIARTP